jgi:hypothetical protein
MGNLSKNDPFWGKIVKKVNKSWVWGSKPTPGPLVCFNGMARPYTRVYTRVNMSNLTSKSLFLGWFTRFKSAGGYPLLRRAGAGRASDGWPKAWMGVSKPRQPPLIYTVKGPPQPSFSSIKHPRSTLFCLFTIRVDRSYMTANFWPPNPYSWDADSCSLYGENVNCIAHSKLKLPFLPIYYKIWPILHDS